jgi:hypothetical protein
MIANQVKGCGFRGALKYVLDKEHKPEIIGGNMVFRDAQNLANEFGISRELRPSLKKAVYHASLSVPQNERLTNEQWENISEKYLTSMGFIDNQYIAVRHADKDHDHIHIIASRISMNGKVVSDSNDYKRSAQIIKGIEKDYNLTMSAQTPFEAKQMDERSTKKGELQKMIRENSVNSKARLQDIIDTLSIDKKSMELFIEDLENNGIGVRANISKTGYISGISYIYGDIAVKGSDLGKKYSWIGLQKRGLDYDKDRDCETIKSASERSYSHQERRPVTEIEGPTYQEYGRTGTDQQAINHESERVSDRIRGTQRKASRTLDQSAGIVNQNCTNTNKYDRPNINTTIRDFEQDISTIRHYTDTKIKDNSGIDKHNSHNVNSYRASNPIHNTEIQNQSANRDTSQIRPGFNHHLQTEPYHSRDISNTATNPTERNQESLRRNWNPIGGPGDTKTNRPDTSYQKEEISIDERGEEPFYEDINKNEWDYSRKKEKPVLVEYRGVLLEFLKLTKEQKKELRKIQRKQEEKSLDEKTKDFEKKDDLELEM